MRFPPWRILLVSLYVGLSAYACSNLGQSEPILSDDLSEAPLCVASFDVGAICTKDINECGFASACTCPDGYVYNSSLGGCLLKLDGVGEAIRAEITPTACAKPAEGVCTRDINVCGQPSTCTCEDGFVWNSVAGACLKV